MLIRKIAVAGSFAVILGFAGSSFAQTAGSATGNGTSTPAGPAGEANGKVMPQGAGSGTAMKSAGTMMKGDASAMGNKSTATGGQPAERAR